jgi:ketosteroid isomerase-like protein
VRDTKVDIVRRLFDAVAARDLGGAKSVLDPKVQFFAPKTGAETGQPYHLYLGHEGIDQYFEHVAAVWREYEFKPLELREREEYVIALGSLRSQPRRGPAGDHKGAWGIRFRDGIIVWARAYLRPRDVLREIPMPKIELIVHNREAVRRRDFAEARIGPELEFRAPVTAAYLGEEKVYRGREGLIECFADVDRAWEAIDSDIDHYWEVGDHVLGLGRLRGRMRDGTEVDVAAQWAWRIEGERLVWASEFTDVDAALRAVGLAA